MNDNVTTFLANLKHDIRNHQSVEVGSGIFKGQELVDVANALAAAPELLAALEELVNNAVDDLADYQRLYNECRVADGQRWDDSPECDETILKARAAIAKARGQA